MATRAIHVTRLEVGDTITYPGPGRGLTRATVTSTTMIDDALVDTWQEVSASLGEPLAAWHRSHTPRVGTWLVGVDVAPWIRIYEDDATIHVTVPDDRPR